MSKILYSSSNPLVRAAENTGPHDYLDQIREECKMPDMLVKLYTLPDLPDSRDIKQSSSILVRRAMVPEKHIVVDWVDKTFGKGWASECEITFSNKPVSCFVALEDNILIGFACYNGIFRNFFGPMGVLEEKRRSGLGRKLLLSCLQSIKQQGYAYAIIGGVGPAEFYSKTVGAVIIDGSEPGPYGKMLKG